MIAGRYSLDREIGRGGMGAVWLGRDEVLGRPIAVKKLGASLGSSTPALERAEREARIAASLNHPHVVAVFDLITEGEVVWLVMEYVEGATLAEVIARNGALPPEDTAAVLGRVAQALVAAHEAGIVHRDVKPSNILVGDDGSVKISDFGIARAETDLNLTQTGLVTGSPAYLAPEVASGGSATYASDVWSLGATAYHALAGTPPYDVGDNLMGALYRIVHEPAPPPQGAGWLRALVEGTMVHDLEQRWSMTDVMAFLNDASGDAAMLAAGVAATAQTEPTLATAPASADATVAAARSDRRRRRSAAPLPVILVAAAIAVALMIGLIVTRDDEPDGVSAEPGVSANDSPTPTPTPTEAEPTDDETEKKPVATEEGIEDFVRNYLATAPSNPDAAFALLTPGFQAASTPGYQAFWSSVQNPEILQISADASARTVSYTYEYNLRDEGRRTEDVSLQLVFQDGQYLIDGES